METLDSPIEVNGERIGVNAYLNRVSTMPPKPFENGKAPENFEDEGRYNGMEVRGTDPNEGLFIIMDLRSGLRLEVPVSILEEHLDNTVFVVDAGDVGE